MISLVPDIEVWGHEEARVPGLLGHVVFKNVDFTNTWKNDPGSSIEWRLMGRPLSPYLQHLRLLQRNMMLQISYLIRQPEIQSSD